MSQSNVCTVFKEDPDSFHVAVVGCQIQRCPPSVISNVDVCFVFWRVLTSPLSAAATRSRSEQDWINHFYNLVNTCCFKAAMPFVRSIDCVIADKLMFKVALEKRTRFI